MLNKLASKYERGKSKKLKLIALCIKSITGVLGASSILSEQKPWISLLILCLGAASNEIVNFISTEENEQTPPIQ